MANEYPNHDWRADEFTLIRGRYCASVAQAWCVSDDTSRPWRWNVFRTDADDCSSIVPENRQQYEKTFGAAIAAAEAFIVETEKLGNVWAFEGAPMPAEENHQEEGGDPWEREKAAAATTAELEPF